MICAKDVDTYGRQFVFVYPPNNGGSSGMKATLNIINPSTKHQATVTVEYPKFDITDDNITVTRHTATLVVKVLSGIPVCSLYFHYSSRLPYSRMWNYTRDLRRSL